MAIAAGALINVGDFPDGAAWSGAGVAAGAGITLSSVNYMADRWGNVRWRGEIYGAATPASNDVLFTFPTDVAPLFRGAWEVGGLGGSALVFVGNYGGTGALTECRFRRVTSGAWPSSATLGVSLAGLTWSRV